MIKFGNSFVNFNGTYLTGAKYNPNPLNLPEYTVRCKFKSGYRPDMGHTQTLVDANENVWDIHRNDNLFNGLFTNCYDLVEVIGANTDYVKQMSTMFMGCSSLSSVAYFDTSLVTNTYCMFKYCHSLTGVPMYDTNSLTSMAEMFYECKEISSMPLFDTSNCKNMSLAFQGCTALTSIPLFNTSQVNNMNSTFLGCSHVEYGALALYNQASTQTTPPSAHHRTFYQCGINTVQGAAELAQIPDDWKNYN